MENTNVTEQSTNEIMPMAASGETNFASLPEKATPASGDMFLMEDSEDTKKINYDKLADAILNKLTSKTYSGLETTAKNFVTAINELNSKSAVVAVVSGVNTIKIQSIWDSTPLSAQERQTIFIFGTANGLDIYGLITVFSNIPEDSRYNGKGDVEVSIDSQGIITVTLPQISWDRFVLISGDPIRLL